MNEGERLWVGNDASMDQGEEDFVGILVEQQQQSG